MERRGETVPGRADRGVVSICRRMLSRSAMTPHGGAAVDSETLQPSARYHADTVSAELDSALM